MTQGANVRVVDAVLALVAVEAVGLSAYHRRTGRGVAPSALLTNLAAGACLLGGVRASMGGASRTVWLMLSMAGLAHVGDLRLRWGRS